MDDIQQSIIEAFERLEPQLKSNPAELAARLKRRNTKAFLRPPRAWCIAVRACDTRIPPECCYPSLPKGFAGQIKHDVYLNAHNLRQLNRSVHIEPMGRPLREVADLLGVAPDTLVSARFHGVFETSYPPNGGGHAGRPTPLLYSKFHLHPNSQKFLPPDPIWSWTATYLDTRVPDSLRVCLTRIPCYYNRNSQYIDSEDDLSAAFIHRSSRSNERKFYSRRLPGPKADHVPYKWKDGHYLGYDWRSPSATDRYFRHLRRAEARREYHRNNPRPRQTQGHGSLNFRGWRWICPLCEKPVRILFFPLPPIELFDSLYTKSLMLNLPPFPYKQSFACRKCHHIWDTNRYHSSKWNRIIAYLSNFLLYGHEVPRPEWLPQPKKWTPKPPRNPATLERQKKILHGLMQNWTYLQIAQTYGFSKDYVGHHAHLLYIKHHVHNRQGLAKKLGITLPAQLRASLRSSRPTI